MSVAPWLDANQRVLAAEFARIRARLTDEDGAAAERELAEGRAVLPSPAAIDVVTQAFELSAFERDVLLMCAGVEMDGGFAAACARLDDTAGRHIPPSGLRWRASRIRIGAR
jgi:hypothetical protein